MGQFSDKKKPKQAPQPEVKAESQPQPQPQPQPQVEDLAAAAEVVAGVSREPATPSEVALPGADVNANPILSLGLSTPPPPAPVIDPLAAVAIPDAAQFEAELLAAAAPPAPEVLAPPPPAPESLPPVPKEQRAPRVRVLERKASVMINGSRCTFVKDQVLDANHYSESTWQQLLLSMMTEPVTE